MNSLHKIVHRHDENAVARLQWRDGSGAKAIHVLSVGPVDRGAMVHDALLTGGDFHLTIATDYRELWRMPTQESIQVVIVQNMLSAFETEAACRLIRRRWSSARILVVLGGDCFLDDALYDDRVTPTAPPEALRAAIGGLIHAGRAEVRNC